MRSLALAALPRARYASTKAATAISPTLTSWATRRTFSSLPRLRPSLLASSSPVFRCPNTPLSAASLAPCPGTGAAASAAPDLVPKAAATAHPWLAGAAQVRFGPRPTMARTSRLVRKRRHGFLSRIRTHNGRKTLQRRKSKKRSMLSN